MNESDTILNEALKYAKEVAGPFAAHNLLMILGSKYTIEVPIEDDIKDKGYDHHTTHHTYGLSMGIFEDTVI